MTLRSTLRLLPYLFVIGIFGFSVWAIASHPNNYSLESQQEATQTKPKFDWSELQPVRPPLDADVISMSEKVRAGLFGPVKQVKEWGEFTSPTNPQWDPTWADASKAAIDNKIWYDPEGNVSGTWQICGMRDPAKLIYDSKGRLIDETQYDMDGTKRYRSVSAYDEKGWLIEKSEYDGNDLLQHKWTYKYVLDSHGNWIGQIPICLEGCFFENNYKLLIMCRSIRYYKKG